MTRTPYYKWRVMKQLFTSPSARHLAERGRDPARVGDDVDVGYAAARKRVDEVLEEGLKRRCPLVTCPRETWLLAAAARRSRGWAAAAWRRACRRAMAPPYGTALLSQGGPRRSPNQKWASSASTCSTASCTSWTRRRRPTSATKRCE